VIGQDDLDLDGNWAPEQAQELEEEALASSPQRRVKKRKKMSEDAGEAVESKPVKKLKKRKNVPSTPDENDTPSRGKGDEPARDELKKKRKEKAKKTSMLDRGNAVAAEDERKKKKKNKKKKTSMFDQGNAAAAEAAAGGQDSCGQAAARMSSAWVAEAKVNKMSSLELKGVVPRVSWFHDCPADARLARLPWAVAEQAASGTWLASLKSGSAAESQRRPRSISIAVLCLSTERVFEALAEISEAWSVGKSTAKPLALAAHGGGRRKDQVARQAKAIAAGVAVAVGTPGRLLRLLEEKHLEATGLDLVVIDLARDRKDRDVLVLPETRRDLFALCRRFLCDELQRDGGCRIVVCGATQK